jgi:hypothetical protein
MYQDTFTVPAELPLFIIDKRERRISMINNLIEYMKIHLISLNQDLENALQGEGYDYLKGQIKATEHLLSVAEDILNNDHQGKGY